MARSSRSFLMVAVLLGGIPAVAGTFTDFTLNDQTPTAPLSNPTPGAAAPRYVSGFGLDDAFTVFFEDRNNSGAISWISTTTGPTGFPAAATATNITDTHFVAKPWPITIDSTAYAYRAWGSVGNNADHRFYVSNDLTTWTLISTFQISNTSDLGDGYGFVYYGFHDVILINGTYYAFAETNTGNTVIVRSVNGDDVWEAFEWMGGVSGGGQLALPEGAGSGWTPRGNFFDLGDDRGMGKLYVDPRDSAIYLAVNLAAHSSLSQADLETAFLEPTNWTWNDDTTGPAANPIYVATSEHDLRECWLIQGSDTASVWTVIYDADFTTGGIALGWFGTTVPVELVQFEVE